MFHKAIKNKRRQRREDESDNGEKKNIEEGIKKRRTKTVLIQGL